MMRNAVRSLAVVLLLIAQYAVAQNVDWENPQMIGINKLPYHSTLQLPSREQECKEIVSLDGTWAFHWSRNPEERPVDFYKTDYNVAGWDKIQVPGNWQTQGFGKAIYTNMPTPYKTDAPRVTSEPNKDWYAYDHRNPVGSYVTHFPVTEDMLRQNVILHFGGVHSAMYVWVNGKKVGYSQNSMSPTEFDITAYLHEGQNRLAVEVYRWCDGSYLEDQDMWRLSGIFRPVQLWVRPLVHIADYHIRTTPKTTVQGGEGTFEAEVKVCNVGKKAAKNIPVQVNIDGQTLSQTIPQLNAGDTLSITFSTTLHNIHLWSANDPYLYPIEVEADGEKFVNHTGFKKVEVKGEVLKINGLNVKLRGVNRHDHHPRTGRYVDRATYDLDIAMMKQCNINFLRTSHYPDDPYLYELCDRYGIFVMDEANNESHEYGIGNKMIGDNPDWMKAHVDRAISLVERDKNHPCVTLWSLGNEAGAGRNPKAMREAILVRDTSRPVFYDSDRSVSDIYDDSYLLPEKFKSEAQRISDKPFMMREYEHAMGNSIGGLQEYWDIIYADSSICGAAIWDWVDQGLEAMNNSQFIIHNSQLAANNTQVSDKQNTPTYLYGGDFGDKPNDSHFCLNGMLNPDRTPHPHFYEVQHVYQPIYFEYRDGQIVKKSMDPFVKVEDFDYVEKKEQVNGETLLSIEARLKTDKPWAKKGFVVAREQFILGQYQYPNTLTVNKNMPKIQRKGDLLTITTSRTSSQGKKEPISLTFDARNGSLLGYSIEEHEMLAQPLEPYFWKPMNDNQRANGYAKRLGSWKDCAKGRHLKDLHIEKGKGSLTLRYEFSLPVGADYQLVYTINGEGEILVEADYKPLKDDIQLMPKFGMRTAIQNQPSENPTLHWYGRGPEENYPDRKMSQFVGEYSKLLTDFQTEYINPQDNSNRCDVRWLTVDTEQHSLTIEGLQPLCIRANNYDDSELDKKENSHPYEIKRNDCVYLNIDLNIHGVGGADGWGAKTFPAYTNPGNKPYHYGFVIKGVKSY